MRRNSKPANVMKEINIGSSDGRFTYIGGTSGNHTVLKDTTIRAIDTLWLMANRVTFKNCTFEGIRSKHHIFADHCVFENCTFKNIKSINIVCRWTTFRDCTFRNVRSRMASAISVNLDFGNSHKGVSTIENLDARSVTIDGKRIPDFSGVVERSLITKIKDLCCC